MKKLDQVTVFSKQDYGTWKDDAAIYEHEGRLLLCIQGGYGEPYNHAWYSLFDKPVGTLEERLTGYMWADPFRDQSEELSDDLGVTARPIEPPKGVFVID